MNNNIPLADIRAFITIAEQESFTHAAEILGSSRAHLSRQLNQLEQQLDVKLLIRTTRSQRLTEAGKLFFDQCRNSLQGIEHAIELAQDQNQQMRGKVRINCVGGIIGEELLSQIVSEFTVENPRIQVEIDFSSERVDLIADEFDLVIRMGELEDSGLIARKITELIIGTWASPNYLSKHEKITHPEQLSHHNCLTGSIKRWGFIHRNDLSVSTEVKVFGNFTCKNGRALLKASLNGQGIVRLPQLYCQQAIKQKQLMAVFEEWQCQKVPLYLLYHKNSYMPERLRQLIEHIYLKLKIIFANEQS